MKQNIDSLQTEMREKFDSIQTDIKTIIAALGDKG